jgi:hypothetical protein
MSRKHRGSRLRSCRPGHRVLGELAAARPHHHDCEMPRDFALHPRTAAHLADLVRIMNTGYSNLIEGHDTRPRDIERALTRQETQLNRGTMQVTCK